VTDIRELLPLYALDALDEAEAREVERAVAADPALATELAASRATAHQMLADVVSISPEAEVKTRLMASIGAGRFERFANRMASLFDVTVDRARELLGLVERSASWENPVPGIGLVHFDGGPACATADCGFVRVAPGCTFPWHTHRGEEVSVILTGKLHDASGRVLGPGDELVQTKGTQHDVRAGDEEVIFVARAFGGIEVGKRP
jgi:putative transcriptional regulator